LFIILLSPILLKKLNIPGIIGLIISGIIIGPQGLNMLAKNSAVDLFSTIGLLYIMFIAGLELDLNEFKVNRNKSLVFGLFTFILPLSIGFPACYYFLGYNFNASFLTASMFATHTLIAYPIVSKLGISKNQAVAITVGGTILTDTAVLIILAVIMGNNKGNLTMDFWIRLVVSLVIFAAIMFLIIPRIAKWFFSNLESEKHSLYIFVLSVVFFAAFLAQAAGVEAIIGAFVAGLALNKLIPHSSALMNRIEFIGNSLFIPFFLISVGMLVDIKILLKGPGALIVAATLTVVALFGKWVAALFTQLIFRYSKSQRQLIFGLSSSHAAATLAIILVGFNAGIIDENILNGTIILILITCIVASFATEKAGKKIILESTDEIYDTQKIPELNNEHILLPVEDIKDVEKLLELSVLLKSKKSANPISILSIVTNNSEAEKNILKARNKLEEFINQGAATETPINLITTIDHNIASGISRVSREIMADIIIMPWPQRADFFEKMIGEKLDTVLSNTDKTTFICTLEKPLVLNKKVVVVIPPMGEREQGFEQWLSKMAALAQELSIPVQAHCNQRTRQAIEKISKLSKFSAAINTINFDDWEDFVILAKHVHDDDLFVLASARKGSVSYMNMLDALPAKLDKYFSHNSKIIIYPRQSDVDYIDDSYDDISTEPLTRGLEAAQKIGKGIVNIFKKEKNK
ncbi:MAG: cation:proton antiporter, partial [Bacteroidetes bacterium]|nr:cation:proton antiporter [Bacteroidota bacterium]